jgi:hypothetical protein
MTRILARRLIFLIYELYSSRTVILMVMMSKTMKWNHSPKIWVNYVYYIGLFIFYVKERMKCHLTFFVFSIV